jgi:FlgD Ig-like domain
VTGSIACVLLNAYPSLGEASTLVLVDISDAHAPAVLASLALPGTSTGMCLDRDVVYVTWLDARWGYSLGTLVIDISDPRAPRALASFPDGYWSPRITNTVLWSVDYDRLTARPAHCAGGVPEPGNPPPLLPLPDALSLNLSPNPSTYDALVRFDLPRAARVTFEVFDVAGRLVRRIDGGALPRGPHEFCWDGRDEQGRAAASGVYLAWLRVDDSAGWEGGSRSARIVRLR